MKTTQELNEIVAQAKAFEEITRMKKEEEKKKKIMEDTILFCENTINNLLIKNAKQCRKSFSVDVSEYYYSEYNNDDTITFYYNGNLIDFHIMEEYLNKYHIYCEYIHRKTVSSYIVIHYHD